MGWVVYILPVHEYKWVGLSMSCQCPSINGLGCLCLAMGWVVYILPVHEYKWVGLSISCQCMSINGLGCLYLASARV